MRWSLLAIGLIVSCSYGVVNAMIDESPQDIELAQAVSWMHANGMTKYETVDEFRPDDFLTRQEAAKFFSEFSVNVLYKVIDQNKFCGFDDLEGADPSLVNHILNSCLLGIFQGTAGYFKPIDNFTKAQALAVLVRSVDGYRNEDTLPRRINYFWKAKELGLTKESDPYKLDRPLLRYEMALMIYRAGTDDAIELGAGQITDTGDQEIVKVDELIKTGGE